MKAVGIKVLKNNLSKYLKIVRGGETILVTDRDEVIAEIQQPSVRGLGQGIGWDLLVARMEREGKARRAERRESEWVRSLRENPLPPAGGADAVALLDELRKDRF